MARSVLKTRLRVTSPSTFRWFALRGLHACVLTSSLAAARLAAAQSIDPLTDTAFSRDQPYRGNDEKPFWINRNDCLADDVLHFDIKVSSASDYNFEVWVGNADCSKPEQRIEEDARCWQVYGAHASTNSFQIDIKVRDIIAQDKGGLSKGTIDVCDDDYESALGIYFMYVDDSGYVKGNHLHWNKTGVDIEGPRPPSEVTAGPGDERVVAKWAASDSLLLTAYNIYCAPAGVGTEPVDGEDSGVSVLDAAAASIGDAGQTSDAGDAASDVPTPDPVPSASAETDAATEDCWGEGLIAGEVPSVDLEICGRVTSRTATRGFATGLTNGERYAVAVAAVDELGNPGQLSNVACGVPEPVDEFYESYRAQGGRGGGGICSVASIGKTLPSPAGTLVTLAVGLVLSGGLVLRRRVHDGQRRRGERQS